MRPCATTLESELSMAELDYLLTTIKSHRFSGKHLEIGTAAGGTLWQMLRCFEEGQQPPFVVIDPMKYFPDQFEKVQNNLRDHDVDPSQVDFRVTTSAEAFYQAENSGETFDFIFIDGAHKIRYVTEDLRWSRLLNVGGILILHDYAPKFPGVQIPVSRFLKKCKNYQILGQAETLIAIQKTKKSPSPEVTPFDRAYSLALTPILQWKASMKKKKVGE